MRNLTLLVADNDVEALATLEEYLTAFGFKILTARSPDEAKQIVDTHLVHLAILDMRMVNDDDDKDRSGLKLARELSPSIPKLILTKFPTHQDVREAMKLGDRPLPPAVDFLNKLDGLDALVEGINQALAQYVRVNSQLVVVFNESHGMNFFYLAGLLTSHPSSEEVQRYAEELEDLFRRLFYSHHQIKVDRLLWHRRGRAAVSVFAYMTGNVPESFMVVLGGPEKIAQEVNNYRNFAPKTPGHIASVLGRTVETVHLAAVAYGLAGLDFETIVPLSQVYQMSSDRVLSSVLTNLFSKTLVEWHENKKISDDHGTLDQWYRTRLELESDERWRQEFRQRIYTLAQQIPALGPELRFNSDHLMFKFGEDNYSYPNPIEFLSGISGVPGPMLLMRTSGELTGDNVLTDGSSRSWVTDFASAGLAPHVWSFINLEATIRFDLIETDKLQWLHEMEKLLVGEEFMRLNAADLEAPLRKPVKAIQIIRKCAGEVMSKQRLPYHFGLLHLAVRRLMDFNPALQLTTHELVRLCHILLATGMIFERVVADMEPTGWGVQGSQSIRIDKSSNTVWLAGVKLKMRGQSYALLCELYEHSNKLCTRRTLVERVFEEKYDELNESQVNRLNTAIRRLREKIEDDPANPRFIITEPHGGYRLAT